jgi:hypothetical protein
VKYKLIEFEWEALELFCSILEVSTFVVHFLKLDIAVPQDTTCISATAII